MSFRLAVAYLQFPILVCFLSTVPWLIFPTLLSKFKVHGHHQKKITRGKHFGDACSVHRRDSKGHFCGMHVSRRDKQTWIWNYKISNSGTCWVFFTNVVGATSSEGFQVRMLCVSAGYPQSFSLAMRVDAFPLAVQQSGGWRCGHAVQGEDRRADIPRGERTATVAPGRRPRQYVPAEWNHRPGERCSGTHRVKWRRCNLWSRYDLHVVQHDVLYCA